MDAREPGLPPKSIHQPKAAATEQEMVEKLETALGDAKEKVELIGRAKEIKPKTIDEIEAEAHASGEGAIVRLVDVATGKTIANSHLTDDDDYILFVGKNFEATETNFQDGRTDIRIRRRSGQPKRPIKDNPQA